MPVHPACHGGACDLAEILWVCGRIGSTERRMDDLMTAYLPSQTRRAQARRPEGVDLEDLRRMGPAFACPRRRTSQSRSTDFPRVDGVIGIGHRGTCLAHIFNGNVERRTLASGGSRKMTH